LSFQVHSYGRPAWPAVFLSRDAGLAQSRRGLVFLRRAGEFVAGESSAFAGIFFRHKRNGCTMPAIFATMLEIIE
jgi:hypothetical protein